MEKSSEKEPFFLIDGRFCPKCGEQILPADVEMFPVCPYCECRFPNGQELEDFVLKPVLSKWASHSFQQFTR